MKDLTIYIPTHSRAGSALPTQTYLPDGVKWHYVVSNEKQRKEYAANGIHNVINCRKKGIARVREWILHNSATRYCYMIDDDLHFAYRTDQWNEEKKYFKLAKMTKEKFKDMLRDTREYLKNYVHVGVCHRVVNAGAPINTLEESTNKRLMNIYAYDTKILLKTDVKFGRVPVMEDFDLTLQLLRAGYPNVVMNNYVWTQSASNNKGGCSDYRTLEVQKKAAEKLHKLHPEFTTLVERDTKTWKAGMCEKRTDVVCYWEKAYASSQK